MKIKLDREEWFPVFTIGDTGYLLVDVAPETIERWRATLNQFEEMQKEMGREIEKWRKPRPGRAG